MKSSPLSGSVAHLKNLLVIAVLSTVCLLNSACTSFSLFSDDPVEIHYSSPDRISFQGKGAGAGIALMSSMGPVGIAIGVAIDEGIAKDIRETAKSDGVDFTVLFKNAVAEMDVLKHAEGIDVKRYGFIIKDGSKDYVAAEVHLKVTENEVTTDVVLSSWPKQQELELMMTLDELKANSSTIKMLFGMALAN